MANFPKVYNAPASAEYYYSITNNSFVPIWTNSDGVNSGAFNDFDESETGTFNNVGSGVIDIYNFSEGAGAGQTAYALLILKNTGTAGSSFVFPSSNSLGLSVNGVDNGNDAANTGFSIVDSIADATVNSVPRIISQADFDGAKDEGQQAQFTIDSKIQFLASNYGVVHEQITINFIDDESAGDTCSIAVTNGYDVAITVDVGETQLSTIVAKVNENGQAWSGF